jgi:hypothetical protein
MTAQSEISSFEKKLESAIKGAFEKAVRNDGYFEIAADYDLLPTSRTKVMEQSPLISENSGYETIQIYR